MNPFLSSVVRRTSAASRRVGTEPWAARANLTLSQLRCPVLLFLLFQLCADTIEAASLPSGFLESTVAGGWNEVVGLTFAVDGRMYAWERTGKVWMVENGVKSATPFIDLREEVGGWRDFGLLGFCLHPNFYQNGYVYLFYMVDHHHAKYFGTPTYDPAVDEYYMATISRLTRYTARASDGFRSVDPASRKVLLGESIANGIPSLHQSHGSGSVLFGTDGTLLLSCGDGASYSSADVGSANETYWEQALSDGIIQPRENVGAFRAQMVDSLNGKILRLDPASGDGVPSNPFYDPARPHSAKSRVWALGLRNPSRITLQPGTGSTNPADANPGVLYIGDVGWRTWEDLNVCTGPGQNFGWPNFEGLEVQSSYNNANVGNEDAPNPLYNVGGCTQRYFYFRDLIKQDSLGTISWLNPCDTSQSVPASIPHFVHRRPAMDWKHDTGPARTGTFSGTNATVTTIGASGSPVSGTSFPGNCSIGGVWYMNADFPADYRNVYYHADWGEGWIKKIRFDSNNKPLSIEDFATGGGGVVFVTSDPINGGLYYISWTNAIKRVRYTSSNNQPPLAVASVDKKFGPSPLTVQFTGTGSSDPENAGLLYSWDFGDGTANSATANPTHVYNAPSAAPTLYTATLVVTDSGGLKATNNVSVSVNNTPPHVTITSPVDGAKYPMTADTTYPCTAIISDAEHDSSQLTCAWQTILHHNQHEHPNPIVDQCTTTTVLSPIGCDGDTYYYRVILTVTDAAGLSTTREVQLFPDCPPPPPVVTLTSPPDGTVFRGPAATIPISATVTTNDWVTSKVVFWRDAVSIGQDIDAPYAVEWTGVPDGIYVLTARALYGSGRVTTSAPVTVRVLSAPNAPLDFVATSIASSQVSVLWSAGSTNQDGFRLERSTNGATFALLVSLPAAARSYVDNGLRPGASYFYRIAATNSQGSSPFSLIGRATTPLFSGAFINFQPANAPVPSGYEADTGAVFGLRASGLTYGWDHDNSTNLVDRNASNSADQRYDTFARTTIAGAGSIWELAVPNGSYDVLLVAGDPNRNNNSVFTYDVEGKSIVNGIPNSTVRWFSGSNTVTVTDGRLTVSNGAGALANKLCFINISAPLDAAISLGWIRRDPSGRVTLRLEGTSGRSYRVDVSEDLRAWQTVATVTNLDGTVSFTDPPSLTRPQRFYRAVFQP